MNCKVISKTEDFTEDSPKIQYKRTKKQKDKETES